MKVKNFELIYLIEIFFNFSMVNALPLLAQPAK